MADEAALYPARPRRSRRHPCLYCRPLPQGAARVHARIQILIDLPLTHPNIGARTDDPDIRRLNTFPYSYLVFYEVAGDEVIIYAVRHGARDPRSMPGEIDI